MSATELLEHLKTLPPSKRVALLRLVHGWETAGNGSAVQPERQPLGPAELQASWRRRFQRGYANKSSLRENIVITARREERF